MKLETSTATSAAFIVSIAVAAGLAAMGVRIIEPYLALIGVAIVAAGVAATSED